MKITKIDITYLDLPSLVKYENSTPMGSVRYVTVCPPKSNHRVALGKNVKNKVKIEIKILALQSFVREKCQVRYFIGGSGDKHQNLVGDIKWCFKKSHRSLVSKENPLLNEHGVCPNFFIKAIKLWKSKLFKTFKKGLRSDTVG